VALRSRVGSRAAAVLNGGLRIRSLRPGGFGRRRARCRHPEEMGIVKVSAAPGADQLTPAASSAKGALRRLQQDEAFFVILGTKCRRASYGVDRSGPYSQLDMSGWEPDLPGGCGSEGCPPWRWVPASRPGRRRGVQASGPALQPSFRQGCRNPVPGRVPLGWQDVAGPVAAPVTGSIRHGVKAAHPEAL
jgi:hypothetical protein